MKVWLDHRNRRAYSFDDTVRELETIARETQVTLFETRADGLAVRFSLRPDRTTGEFDRDYGRRGMTLHRWQRRSASPFSTERKIHAVCWHGHYEYLRRLFERFPNARVSTAFADYRGIRGFADNFEATGYRNIGAPVMPVSMREACYCHERGEDWRLTPIEFPEDDNSEELTCPECGEIVWDLPEGHNLAKCWNAEGHSNGLTLAFDTMEEN